jgi:hypothetical protein
MVLMFLERTGENEDVIQVGESEVESSYSVVHEALESLGGVEQAEGQERKLE